MVPELIRNCVETLLNWLNHVLFRNRTARYFVFSKPHGMVPFRCFPAISLERAQRGAGPMSRCHQTHNDRWPRHAQTLGNSNGGSPEGARTGEPEWRAGPHRAAFAWNRKEHVAIASTGPDHAPFIPRLFPSCVPISAAQASPGRCLQRGTLCSCLWARSVLVDWTGARQCVWACMCLACGIW